MSDSVSASKYLDQAIKEMEKADCKKSKTKKHSWQAQTPFYGASQCKHCKKVVYTK